jgi:hypothetical protein
MGDFRSVKYVEETLATPAAATQVPKVTPDFRAIVHVYFHACTSSLQLGQPFALWRPWDSV